MGSVTTMESETPGQGTPGQETPGQETPEQETQGPGTASAARREQAAMRGTGVMRDSEGDGTDRQDRKMKRNHRDFGGKSYAE